MKAFAIVFIVSMLTISSFFALGVMACQKCIADKNKIVPPIQEDIKINPPADRVEVKRYPNGNAGFYIAYTTFDFGEERTITLEDKDSERGFYSAMKNMSKYQIENVVGYIDNFYEENKFTRYCQPKNLISLLASVRKGCKDYLEKEIPVVPIKEK